MHASRTTIQLVSKIMTVSFWRTELSRDCCRGTAAQSRVPLANDAHIGSPAPGTYTRRIRRAQPAQYSELATRKRKPQVTIRLAMSTPAETAKPGKRNLAGKGSAFTVALGIFLSRVAGLVRDRVFAHYFGNSDA